MVRNLEILTIVLAMCGSLVCAPPSTEKAKTAAKAVAKAMPVENKEKLKNNIRRLLQGSKLERARGLIKRAIGQGKRHPDNSDLLGYGYWAQAVLYGYEARTVATAKEKEAAKTDCLKFIDKAIENGWRNPFSFEYAALIDDDIRTSAEFKQRIETLKVEFASSREADFRAKLKTGPATTTPFTLPASVTDSDTLSALVEGKSAVLVISRIYHDGFRKIAPVLKTLDAEFRDSVPTLILFYQNFPASPLDQKRTEKFYQPFELSAPFAFVTREYIKPLDLAILPVLLFLDAEGRLVLRQDGLVEGSFLESFLRIAYGELKATAVKEAPVEKPEKPEAKKKTDV